MKYLKTLDFAGQTFIFAAYLIGSVWITIAEQTLSSWGLTTAYAMLCLGWWQMISAALMLILKAPNKKHRRIHFLTAVGYLSAICLVPVLTNDRELEALASEIKFVAGAILILTPLALAIFYYTITWSWMFPVKSTGKFLPHVSF